MQECNHDTVIRDVNYQLMIGLSEKQTEGISVS